jgi:MFS family permease
MSSTQPATLGPIRFASGVRRRHALAYLFAALLSIGLYTYFSALTPYVLQVNLGLEPALHGRISGDLQSWQEIVLLLTIGVWGALSDRVGRRLIYIVSLLVMALGYGLYGFAGSTAELFACRMLLGFGIAGSSAMLITIIADYPEEFSRGKFTGLAFFLNGLGAALFFFALTKLPLFFESQGADPLWAGRFSLLVVAGIALLTAVVMLGLKPGRPDAVEERVPLLTLLRQGLAAGLKPRISLCYAGAFAARADMAIITIFITLWVAQSGVTAGISAASGAARAGIVIGITLLSALVWSPLFGWLGDRLDRVTVMIVGFGLAALGYGWIGSIDDPAATTAIPALILLGVGQSSAVLASTLLLGQEAPTPIRGSVFGVQSFCGALGILAISAGGGRLFDAVGPWAPFAVMGVVNGVVCLWAIAVRSFEAKVFAPVSV